MPAQSITSSVQAVSPRLPVIACSKVCVAAVANNIQPTTVAAAMS